MGHDHISRFHQGAEILEGRLPGLGQAGDRGRNAIDGLGGIALRREQKGLLGQHLTRGDVEQNGSHLKAVIQCRIKTCGLRVDDQECARGIRGRDRSDRCVWVRSRFGGAVLRRGIGDTRGRSSERQQIKLAGD